MSEAKARGHPFVIHCSSARLAPSPSPIRTRARLTTVPSSRAIPEPSTAAAMTNRPVREPRTTSLTPAVCHRGCGEGFSARALLDGQVPSGGPGATQAEERVDGEDDEGQPDDAEADPPLARHVLVEQD